MKKIYLEKSRLCPICNKKSKRFIQSSDIICCHDCFIKIHSEFSTPVKNKRKRYSKSYFDKSIYAVNGVQSVYIGGCIN